MPSICPDCNRVHRGRCEKPRKVSLADLHRETAEKLRRLLEVSGRSRKNTIRFGVYGKMPHVNMDRGWK